MKLIGLEDQLVQLLGTGLVAMGIMDFVDEEEGESVDADDGDDLFGDGVADGGGNGMDGGLDDEFGGMDDGMEMDGEMDDWADGGDEFGMEGGTGPTQELENRIDELENEVADISSTVSTVRSENEQISEKVDETEENVRKLLEIYEMVTRGVNPFVDDVQGGGMAAGGDAFGAEGEGGFGLFDGEEEEEEEDIDSDLAEAEAESFFDDDFEDDDFEDDAGDDLGFESPDEAMSEEDTGGDGMDFDEDTGSDDEMDFDEDTGSDDGGQAGGSTFEELKEEYESGDADWADDTDSDSDTTAEAEVTTDEPEIEDESGIEDEPEREDEPETVEDAEAGEFEFDEPSDAEPVAAADAEPAGSTAARSGFDTKPYLAELPKGYVADLVVMEWLEFLVTEFGPEDTVRTIEYYGDIGWISESVEEELLAFVSGFADVESVDPEETGPATLEIDDHIRSLTFLSQLTGDAVQRRIVEHCAQIRGGRDGIQR